MEQGRLLIAIALSFLVFLVWGLFFEPKPEHPPRTVSDKAVQTPAAPSVEPRPPVAVEKEQPPPAEPVPADQPGTRFETLRVENSLYTAEISANGAAFTSFLLKDYKETMAQNSGPKQLIPKENEIGTALLDFVGNDLLSPRSVFTTDASSHMIRVDAQSQSVTFYWRSPSGIAIEKRFTFFPDDYKINLAVTVKNFSDQPVDKPLAVMLANPVSKNNSYSFTGPVSLINNDLEQIKIKDIKKKNTYTGSIAWAGIEEQYFITTLVPETISEKSMIHLSVDPQSELVKIAYADPVPAIAPGAQHTSEYSMFLGPKRLPLLEKFGHHLTKAVNFGFFDVIAKPCLRLMDYVHDHLIANYGIAIILLTILFKLIFWPLGSKSYKSMAEMKKLQPLMTEIRKKYKDDKKKMNEEIMGLYRTYKVNPMSGCLPMVVQIPVFLAFYRMLYGAIELRHAPFFLWINDLSAPDRLLHFNFAIPFMAPPYGIPVLTIIMGATMFLQQKLSPPPGDPSQAKIMMLMPLVFTVIFINFPSGLVLYWLVNNVLSIAQQYYITRKIA